MIKDESSSVLLESSPQGSHGQQSFPLLGGSSGAAKPELPGRAQVMNPHLLAARRLARKMRQLPDHSAEETRTGLAICHQLKAYLRDDTGIRPH